MGCIVHGFAKSRKSDTTEQLSLSLSKPDEGAGQRDAGEELQIPC